MKDVKYKKGSVFGLLDKNELILYTVGVFTVFSLFSITMYVFGFVPEGFQAEDPIINIDQDEKKLELVKEISEKPKPTTTTLPESIKVPTVGISSIINHPTSVDIPTLDNALQKGAVYYPGSGSLEEGNIFLFGHSSNWAVVRNPAYKIFNGIEKLERGDEIILEAKGYQYIYKVDKVTLVDESAALVNLKSTGNKLTISTCNTFGKKAERWVVESTFYKKVAI